MNPKMNKLSLGIALMSASFATTLSLTANAGLFGDKGPSDYAKLDGFHDVAMEKGSSTSVFKDKKPRASWTKSNPVMEADFRLSDLGLAKVHIKDGIQQAPDKKGYLGYGEGYFEVTVNAGTAQNLKWEIWNSDSQAQMHSAFGSTSVNFKKILGPFKAGEVIKLDLLKSTSDSYGTRYVPISPLIVVYSPSELGKTFSVEVHDTKPAE